jgi:SAM-dependent methyltransferase
MSSRAIDWYDRHGATLAETYESLDFKVTHGWLLDLLPERPGLILDVGAGSGRDAAGLARMGYEVVAVEPSSSMLREGSMRHVDARIRWLDDRLPALDATHRTGLAFDLILLSGVWQHVPPGDRPRAFRKLVRLLNPGGVLAITLRLGTADPEREMYEVSRAEIEALARGHGAFVERCVDAADSLGRGDVHWIQLALRLPDDGTGALPLLRHVILQDAKSSTYKLALLRSIARIADGAAGLVRAGDADRVSVPLGLVALYWVRLFLPLLSADLPQSPTNRGLVGLGFVNEGFQGLTGCAPNDLRVGTHYGTDLGAAVHGALVGASRTIALMPAHYMTLPNGRPVMEAVTGRAGRAPSSLVIDEAYLRRFGDLLVPVNLWRAMSRFDAWIEPAIVAEWVRLMHGYALRQGRELSEATIAQAMHWSAPERVVAEARQRAISVIESGQPLHCVWSGARLSKDRLDIDHCFPWSAWPCDDLWNLLPSTRSVNQHEKRDRLPSASLLNSARERVQDWWRAGYALGADSPFADRFFLEARSSLPMIIAFDDLILVDDVFDAVAFQRLRLKENQQIPEWAGRPV